MYSPHTQENVGSQLIDSDQQLTACLQSVDDMSRSRWGIRHLYHRSTDRQINVDLEPSHVGPEPLTPRYGPIATTAANHDDVSDDELHDSKRLDYKSAHLKSGHCKSSLHPDTLDITLRSKVQDGREDIDTNVFMENAQKLKDGLPSISISTVEETCIHSLTLDECVKPLISPQSFDSAIDVTVVNGTTSPPEVVVIDYTENVMTNCSLNKCPITQRSFPNRLSPQSSFEKLPSTGNTLQRTTSSSSYGSATSSRSAFSESSAVSFDDDFDQPYIPTDTKRTSWKMIRNALYWSPFVQQYKQNKIPWIQLAGHQGSFLTGTEPGAILKKLCPRELRCLQLCNEDKFLTDYVPKYINTVEKDGISYIQMQDLLYGFDSPSVLDCKIGIRTYLEEELEKARKKPSPRNDMYCRMVELDASEPTKEENIAKAVTKPRYMLWREDISSTCTLGFRIEGLRKWNEDHSLVLKRTKTFDQVTDAIRFYTGSNKDIQKAYLQRLKDIEYALINSQFFKNHEVIGSSLLFVHDATGKVGIYMIDFGKTSPIKKDSLKHDIAWKEGNHEDGYLIGVKSLQNIFSSLCS